MGSYLEVSPKYLHYELNEKNNLTFEIIFHLRVPNDLKQIK